jgi:hypothetical protein
MRKDSFIALIATALLIANPCFDSQATAGGIVGPEIPIYESDVDQVNVAVAYNWQRDEFLVVWENERAGGVHDIYARRVSGDGALLSQFAITGGDGISRMNPDVDYDPIEDRYLVVYSKYVNAGDQDIYGRFIPWAGPDAGLTEFIIGAGIEFEYRPKIAYGQGDLIGEQFLVVWAAATSPKARIRGAFVKGDGSGTSVPWEISPADQHVHSPGLAYNRNRNEFLVVWTYPTSLYPDADLRGVIINASGAEVHGGWFQIASDIDDQLNIDAAACADEDQYLVTYGDQTTYTWDLKAQRIDGDRILHGSSILIQTTSYYALDPVVACFNAAALYLVAWTQGYLSSTGPGGVWARTLNTDGEIGEGIEVMAPTLIGDSRAFPAVAAGSPEFLLAWRHQRDAAVSWDVHGGLVRPVAFLDGFESGNTSKWSSKVP